MLRLYVLRHTKSSWAAPGQRDIDRELSERGRADARKIGITLRQRQFVPAHVYCSPAVRTRQTLAGIAEGFPVEPQVVFAPSLYGGSANDYLDCIGKHTGTGSLMLIGHNPMCMELALTLAGDGAPAALKRLAEKYPTGGLAVFDFDRTSWSDIGRHTGMLADFVVPRNL